MVDVFRRKGWTTTIHGIPEWIIAVFLIVAVAVMSFATTLIVTSKTKHSDD